MQKNQFTYTPTTLWTAFVILISLFIGAGIARAAQISALSFSSSFSRQSGPFDFGNRMFQLDNQELSFTDGFYKSHGASHLAYITDRNINRSLTKAAAILIDNPEGSGTFYYVVGATRKNGKEMYSKPVFLGDRRKIEAVSLSEDAVTVQYLDRPANTPMATEPTEKVTVTFTFEDDGNLYAEK